MMQPPGAAGVAAVDTLGREGVLVGAHGEADLILEDAVLADEAHATAVAAGAAGVWEEFEALDLGRKVGLDDRDGGDLAVTQVKGGGGGAVLAVSSAAAAEDLVLDV